MQTRHFSRIQSQTKATALPNVWRALETFAPFLIMVYPSAPTLHHCAEIALI